MKHKVCIIGFSLIISHILIPGCDNRATPISADKKETGKTIIVQPLNDFDKATTRIIVAQLETIYDKVELKESIELPVSAMNHTASRFRADSIIRILRRATPKHATTIGLIHNDISTTKGEHADWGVMGLGYRPGNACVASTFRLNKKNSKEQLFKVAIHELGHTAGLPHCPHKTCYMRDAEGGNPTDEEKEFCSNCKQLLISEGWHIAAIGN